MVFKYILLSSALISAVYGHGRITSISAGGKTFVGASPYANDESPVWKAANGDNGFVLNNDSPANIACHKQNTPGALSIPVQAGAKLDFTWNQWPESHHGPIVTYMAKCSGTCQTADAASLKWFKVEQAGLLKGGAQGSQVWADDAMAKTLKTDATVPASIAAGDYVLRHEIIALHEGNQGGDKVQLYPMCMNLQVSGGGSANPAGVTAGQLYTSQSLGFNIYQQVDSYPIPGPALFSAAGSGGSSPAPAPAPAPAPSSKPANTVRPAPTTIPTMVTSVRPQPTSGTGTGSSGGNNGGNNGGNTGGSNGGGRTIRAGTSVQDILAAFEQTLNQFAN